MGYGGWAPYVSVAKRREKAAKEIAKLVKKGLKVEPVEVQGRKITRTFWGSAWCNHLENFSDYENRLPRGRTYVRNGSVCHLAISKGKVEAIVSGSKLYKININITPLAAKKWDMVRKQCAGQIGSMLELLQGRFSDHVMAIVTDQESGLFPHPNEIKLACNCPDWAEMCKHIAAVLYGIGARLDQQPELLFLLRNVDHEELISAELNLQSATTGKGKRRRLAAPDLCDVFGVDMEEPITPLRKKDVVAKKVAKKKNAVNMKKNKMVDTDKPIRKKAAGAKKAIKKTATVKVNKNEFTPTAAAIRKLRKRLDMTPLQFSALLGVSPLSVSNWEKSSGKLNLRQRSLEALSQVANLSPEQAKKKLKRL